LKRVLEFESSSWSCKARPVIESPVTGSSEVVAFWAVDVKGDSKEAAGVCDLGTDYSAHFQSARYARLAHLDYHHRRQRRQQEGGGEYFYLDLLFAAI
jgi:hypothetical protein